MLQLLQSASLSIPLFSCLSPYSLSLAPSCLYCLPFPLLFLQSHSSSSSLSLIPLFTPFHSLLHTSPFLSLHIFIHCPFFPSHLDFFQFYPLPPPSPPSPLSSVSSLSSLSTVWALPKAEVELGQSLGKGEFGEVVMAIYRGVQVAGKVIHEDMQNAANTTSFLKEAAILT